MGGLVGRAIRGAAPGLRVVVLLSAAQGKVALGLGSAALRHWSSCVSQELRFVIYVVPLLTLVAAHGLSKL